jgi:hypothetical protein
MTPESQNSIVKIIIKRRNNNSNKCIIPICILFLVFFWIKFHLHGIKEPGWLVGIATSYGLDDRGLRVRVPVRSRIFSSPRRPERGSPNLLSNGYLGSFRGGEAAVA